MAKFIRGLLAKARGILGLGLAGGAVGFLGGFLGALLPAAVDAVVHKRGDLWLVVVQLALRSGIDWALLGMFVGSGFGSLVALTSRRRSLEELSPWRMGLLGGLAGALFVPIALGIEGGWAAAAEASAAITCMSAALGAALSTSLVVVAQRADRAELGTRDGSRRLGGKESEAD